MIMRTLIPAALIFLIVGTPLHAAITGRIVSPEGTPLAGIAVEAFREESSKEFAERILSEFPPIKKAVARGTTGEDGTFSLEVSGTPAFSLLVGDRFLHKVVDGEDAGVIVLPAPRSSRLVVTASGKPLADAVVMVGRIRLFRTDAAGVVEAPATLLDAAVAVIHPDFGVRNHGFSVGPGGMKIDLRREAAVRGRVVAGDDDTPVAGATISVERWPLAVSGEDGSFEIAIPPQDWRQLMATHGNRVATGERSKSAEYVLRLRPAATIRGTARSAVDQRPLAGTVVTATDGRGTTFHWVFTDRKGNFSLGPLPAGVIHLSASRSGYRSAPPEKARVTAGSAVERTLTLTRSRMRGIVVDEEKKPVPGALVTSWREAALTAADGTFEVTVLPPIVKVTKKGFATAVHGPITMDAPEPKEPVTIVLRPGFELRVRLVSHDGEAIGGEPLGVMLSPEDPRRGSTREICSMRECTTGDDGSLTLRVVEGMYDFVAGGATVPIVNLRQKRVTADAPLVTLRALRGASVSGKVVVSDGSAVASDHVRVFIKSPRHTPGAALVGSDGSFTLENVPAGPLTLVARRMVQNASSIEGPPVEIDAPANGVVLEIPAPQLVTGRVVSRATREPVPEFSMEIRRRRGNGYSANTQPFSSSDGSFSIDAAGTPALDLIVSAAGFAPSAARNVAVAGGEPVVIHLDAGGSISGRVVAESRPVPGAMVHLQHEGATMHDRQQPVRTDADGRFSFDGAASGEHLVRVVKEGLVTAVKTVAVEAGRPTEVEITMSQGHAVAGRVIDENGRPVAGARVSAGANPRHRSGTGVETDAEGAFSLGGLDDGVVTIAAEKSGYVRGVVENVDPLRTGSVTVTLVRGATIAGRVIGLSPAELSDVRIFVIGLAAGGEASTVDPDGRFTLSGVPDGVVRVHASIMGGTRRAADKTVEVRNGSAPAVEIEFASGFRVEGTLRRGGEPVANAAISFDGQDASRRGVFTHTSPNGSYTAELAGGSYLVWVQMGDARMRVGSITVAGPARHDFDIRGAVLEGRVLDDTTGAPLPDVSVRFQPIGRSEPGGMTTTDGGGAFRVDPIGAGRVRVSALKPGFGGEASEIDLVDGETARVELRMIEGTPAIVRVVDSITRRVIEGASVVVYDAGRRPVETGSPFPQADGSLRLWLPPGRYSAQVRVMDYVPESISVSVPGPEVVVPLTRAGRVVLQGSLPSGSMVRFINVGNTERAVGGVISSSIQSGGAHHMRPGPYRLEVVDAKGKVLLTRPVTVIAGETSTVVIGP